MTRYRLMGSLRLLAAMMVLMITACGVPDTGSSATQPSAEAPPVVPTPSPAPTPAPTTPQNTLTNGSWQLVRFGPTTQPTKPISDTIGLSFMTDGKLGGSGGCNSFFGSYVITGTLMTISEVGSTMMACMPEGLMTQETQYLAALGSVSEFAQTDTTLTLRYPEGELVFDYLPPPPARTLENTAWRFNGFLANDAVSMLVGAQSITFELRDGQITGNAGCNRYNGPVAMQGQDQQLSFGPIVSTKMACDALEAEQQFLSALQAVTGWEIKDQTLTLQYPGGGLLFVTE